MAVSRKRLGTANKLSSNKPSQTASPSNTSSSRQRSKEQIGDRDSLMKQVQPYSLRAANNSINILNKYSIDQQQNSANNSKPLSLDLFNTKADIDLKECTGQLTKNESIVEFQIHTQRSLSNS